MLRRTQVRSPSPEKLTPCLFSWQARQSLPPKPGDSLFHGSCTLPFFIDRLCRFVLVLFLTFAQLTPTGVLRGFGLGGVGIFFAPKPKTKPVYVSLLGHQPLPRLHE